MKYTAVQVIVMFVLMCFIQVQSQIEIEYRYYDLALQKCNSSSPYTIHGLWPEYSSTLWPAYCDANKQFNYTQLEPLLVDLNKYWYTCEEASTSSTFWKHEWQKHGTCQPLSEVDYFNHTLYLFYQARDTGLIDSKCSKEQPPHQQTEQTEQPEQTDQTDQGSECLLRVNLNGTFN